jgi:hypothetical protein
MNIQPFLSVVPIYSNIGEGTHPLNEHSASLISGSVLIKQWGATHSLDARSATLVSGSDTGEQTHILDAYSAILVSSFNHLIY